MSLTIQSIEEQLKNVCAQRDQASTTFQQCIGAVAILSEQLRILNVEEQSNKEIIDTAVIQGDDYVCIKQQD